MYEFDKRSISGNYAVILIFNFFGLLLFDFIKHNLNIQININNEQLKRNLNILTLTS